MAIPDPVWVDVDVPAEGDTEQQTVHLEGLEPGTEYEVDASAFNALGPSQRSPILLFSTAAAIPDAPGVYATRRLSRVRKLLQRSARCAAIYTLRLSATRTIPPLSTELTLNRSAQLEPLGGAGA